MSVDISPKRPPISSCTALAPAGSRVAGRDVDAESVVSKDHANSVGPPRAWGNRRPPVRVV
jgi:hypothetical protein